MSNDGERPKIKIKLDDPETRAVWESTQRAKEEVAGWPAWKRGDAASPGSVAPREAGTCAWCEHVAGAFEWCTWCTALRQAARFVSADVLERALADKRNGLL